MDTRLCNNPFPQHGGTHCIGSTKNTVTCTMPACTTVPAPINGGWGSWQNSSTCSVGCGIGDSTQTRSCNSPARQHGGTNCIGPAGKTVTCIMPACPTVPAATNGHWGTWSFGSCSLPCGGGELLKTRACDNPSPHNDGLACSGIAQQTEICNSAVCSPAEIDGQFNTWSQWSPCTLSCGTGIRSRSRQCNSPAPANGGEDCSGSPTAEENCNPDACPGNTGGGGTGPAISGDGTPLLFTYENAIAYCDLAVSNSASEAIAINGSPAWIDCTLAYNTGCGCSPSQAPIIYKAGGVPTYYCMAKTTDYGAICA